MVDVTTGLITNVAGTGISGHSGDRWPTKKARIGVPAAIRFDAAGNIYFTDLTQHVVRKVDTAGYIPLS